MPKYLVQAKVLAALVVDADNVDDAADKARTITLYHPELCAFTDPDILETIEVPTE